MMSARTLLEILNAHGIKHVVTVGGSLDLRDTAITSLPDGLTVGGSLNLRGTAITSLPDGLTVGGSLDLRDTAIRPGRHDSIIVPAAYSMGEYTVTGRVTPDGLRIVAGCFSGAVAEARERARGRTAYVQAIDQIVEIYGEDQ